MQIPKMLFLAWLIPALVLMAFAGRRLAAPQIDDRVAYAYKQKETAAKELFLKAGLPWPPPPIFLRGLKRERVLELWSLNPRTEKYVLVHTFPVCALSGDLGPKRREGDRQVPEGIYEVSGFNPRSSYFLSMRINYPNASDKVRGVPESLGSDIFLHGDCVSIGCLALTDDGIQLLYVTALEAKKAGQRKIPVHLFPSHLTHPERLSGTPEQKAFWKELAPAYQHFETNKEVPNVEILPNGSYRLKI